MRKWLTSVFLMVALSGPAFGQSVYSAGLTGIYWNPTLVGWGFTMDIQRGLMFVAVFGYDTEGGEAFLTLISDRVSPAAQFSYDGDVLLNNENGTMVTDVGDFTWQIGRTNGQPSIELDMTSPFMDLEDFQLIRFGYLDADTLSPIAGKAWSFGYTDGANGTPLDNVRGILFTGNQRIPLEGRTVIEVGTFDAAISGIAYLDVATDLFIVVLEDQFRPGEQTVLSFVANHEVMSFGQADLFVGSNLVASRPFQAVVSATDIGVNKVDATVDLKRARALLKAVPELDLEGRVLPPVIAAAKD